MTAPLTLFMAPHLSRVGLGYFFCLKLETLEKKHHDSLAVLNEITIKNWYPLPLIAFTFELLQEATIFTKLDLCKAWFVLGRG